MRHADPAESVERELEPGPSADDRSGRGEVRGLAHRKPTFVEQEGARWDNPVDREFVASLTSELRDEARFATQRATINATADDMNFYDAKRRPCRLGDINPIEFDLRSRPRT
jgi:hypothetical protein